MKAIRTSLALHFLVPDGPRNTQANSAKNARATATGRPAPRVLPVRRERLLGGHQVVEEDPPLGAGIAEAAVQHARNRRDVAV